MRKEGDSSNDGYWGLSGSVFASFFFFEKKKFWLKAYGMYFNVVNTKLSTQIEKKSNSSCLDLSLCELPAFCKRTKIIQNTLSLQGVSEYAVGLLIF